MGGSWDATNVIAGDAAVITPIGMDHVAELGPTLADIATEKAGIIKEGTVAAIREQDPVRGGRCSGARERGRRDAPAGGRRTGRCSTR